MFSPNRKYKKKTSGTERGKERDREMGSKCDRASKTTKSTNDGSISSTEHKKNFCTNDRLFLHWTVCVFVCGKCILHYLILSKVQKDLVFGKMSPPKKWANNVCCFSFEYCREFPLLLLFFARWVFVHWVFVLLSITGKLVGTCTIQTLTSFGAHHAHTFF